MSWPSKLTLLLLLIAHNVFDVTLTDNLQHQSEFVDTNNITRWDQRSNVKLSDEYKYMQLWNDDVNINRVNVPQHGDESEVTCTLQDQYLV
jgi:hypothetical protein